MPGRHFKASTGGRSRLKFRTAERKSKTQKRLFICLFILFIVLAASVSLTVLFREYGPVGGQKQKQESPPFKTAADKGLKREVNILFGGTDDSKKELRFLFLLSMDTKKKEFCLTALPLNDTVRSAKGTERHENYTERHAKGKQRHAKGTARHAKASHSFGSLQSAFYENKAEGLVKAAEAISGKEIDRYALVTEKKFRQFVSVLGDPEYDIPEDIDFSSAEYSLKLSPGKQTLSGEKLYNYLRYVGRQERFGGQRRQAELLSVFIRQCFREENAADSEELFSEAVNCCDSDISVMDFAKYRAFLDGLSESSFKINIGNSAGE